MAIGGSKGAGFQPQIIKESPKFFEEKMRWILGGEDYLGAICVPLSTIKKYLCGNEIGEKHNNIQRKIFNEITLLHEDELVQELKLWLKI